MTPKTLLQINSVINSGSTGRIAEGLGKLCAAGGWKSYIVYGRNPQPSASVPIRIGSGLSVWFHVLLTRVFDAHGFGSYFSTKKLVKQINRIRPDVIHLHNIHGYYLNVSVLFGFLRRAGIPVVWTLHDCWAFTGHCAYYTFAGCGRWQSGCFSCPRKKSYPASFLADRSGRNYKKKAKLFTGIKNMTIVTPSAWLKADAEKSFLARYQIRVIPNGINLSVFCPQKKAPPIPGEFRGRKIVLGVANVWSDRKGLCDFVRLSKILPREFLIVLVGVTDSQRSKIPENIFAVSRTESQTELAEFYSAAAVFFNPTYEDNFPTTNIEALACGTPVVTYDTGGSPEMLSPGTGFVLKAGDVESAKEKIVGIAGMSEAEKAGMKAACVNQGGNYSEAVRFGEYMKIYESLTE